MKKKFLTMILLATISLQLTTNLIYAENTIPTSNDEELVSELIGNNNSLEPDVADEEKDETENISEESNEEKNDSSESDVTNEEKDETKNILEESNEEKIPETTTDNSKTSIHNTKSNINLPNENIKSSSAYSLTELKVTPSNKNGFSISKLGTGEFEFTKDGLKIKAGSDNSGKVYGSASTSDIKLSDLANENYDLEYTKTSGTAPAINIKIKGNPSGVKPFPNPGTNLVYEKEYYTQGYWWATKLIPDVATNPGGGGVFYNTLESIGIVYGDLDVSSIGFALGSGVPGSESIIKSLTVGNRKYTFGVDELKIVYNFEGLALDTQTTGLENKLVGDKITKSELIIPTGYRLKDPFPDRILADLNTIELEVVKISPVDYTETEIYPCNNLLIKKVGTNEFVDDILRVTTTTTAQKSAGYIKIPTDNPLKLSNLIENGYSINFRSEGTGAVPGININFAPNSEAGKTPFPSTTRYFVNEDKLFGYDEWWSTLALTEVAGPVGSYKKSVATLDTLLDIYGDLTIREIGYSLGTGAIGSVDIESINIGDRKFTFDEKYALNIDYTVDSVSLGTAHQQRFEEKKNTIIKQSDLIIPNGYKLKVPFADYTITKCENIKIELELEETYNVIVKYTYNGREISYQNFLNRDENSIISISDLILPKDYKIVGTFSNHTVTKNITIFVPVDKTKFNLTIIYKYNGNTISTQELKALEYNTTIKKSNLNIPSGYYINSFEDFIIKNDSTININIFREESSTNENRSSYSSSSSGGGSSSSKGIVLDSGDNTTIIKDDETPLGVSEKLLEGYIHGFPDKYFKPNNNLTRAELAQIIYKLYGQDQATYPKINFNDLKMIFGLIKLSHM